MVMFIMMNLARFSVGMEGVGVSERAYQRAVAYAKDRVQGRPVGTDGMGTALNQPRALFGRRPGGLTCCEPRTLPVGALSEAGQEATSHT